MRKCDLLVRTCAHHVCAARLAATLTSPQASPLEAWLSSPGGDAVYLLAAITAELPRGPEGNLGTAVVMVSIAIRVRVDIIGHARINV